MVIQILVTAILSNQPIAIELLRILAIHAQTGVWREVISAWQCQLRLYYKGVFICNFSSTATLRLSYISSSTVLAEGHES